MPYFINTNLDKKIYSGFALKHLLFSAFWIVGILIFIFRIDVVIMNKYGEELSWLIVSIPTLYFSLFFISFLFLKWYYKIAFLFYPFLVLFWFIPKTVLSVGKVYLLGSYLSSIFSRLANLKLFVLNLIILILSFIFLIFINNNWIKWFSIIVATYLYLLYVIRFLKNAFKPPILFGEAIENEIKKLLNVTSPEKSLVVSSFVLNKEDEKLEITERNEKQIRRSILANYAIELLSMRLNGFHGRKAYLVSWLFGATVFLLSSVIFFWFLNFQLFKISGTNFFYTGNYPIFDFLYYTLKTITFSNIEIIRPISILARISEISSFFTIGIFTLIILISVILSLKQDKVKENLKLTMNLFEHENSSLSKYMKEKFGMEIKNAINDVKDIEKALRNLKKFINRIV